MAEHSNNEMPSTVLKQEHKIILRVIEVLKTLVTRSENGEGLEIDSLKRCVEFFRLFADACHHAKEEDLLFPVLESRGVPRDGGPIGVMLYEHQVARQLTREMGDALDSYVADEKSATERFHSAAKEYIDLLTNHIFKEDNVLFNMGDNVMSDDDQASLCQKFCAVGCRAFGGKQKGELEAIAIDLESQWAK